MILANNNIFIIIVAIVLLIAGLIIGWLLGRRPQSEDGEKPPSKPEPRPVSFANNQIILAGTRSAINQFVDNALTDFGFRLVRMPYREIPARVFNQEAKYSEQEAGEEALQQLSPDEAANQVAVICGLVTETFRIAENQQGLTLAQIQELATNNGLIADRNYKTGRPVLVFEGDPESTEGFPFMDANPGAAEKAFFNQWAFHRPVNSNGRVGIQLYNELFNPPGNDFDKPADIKKIRTVEPDGQGVVVAVFDTSPYDNYKALFDQDVAIPPPNSGGRSVQQVAHYAVPGLPDARDHGLFGVSLIKAVAPECECRLYRVLNDSNRGDLNILLQALDQFILDMAARNDNEQPLKNCVINLSLGITVEPDELLNEGSLVPALAQKLKCMHELGAVIVAASGNDSAELVNPLPAQIPAAFDFVIGVGASNSSGGRGRFSNLGDVYAPGGENDQVIPVVCSDTNDDDCVIGFAQSISPDTKFAYWRGTSFSAPMVSGLAALLLDKGLEPAQVKGKIIAESMPMTPPVTATASGGQAGGIINIPKTVN